MAAPPPRTPLAPVNGVQGQAKRRRYHASNGVVKETTRNIRKTFECLFPGPNGEVEKKMMLEKVERAKARMGGAEITTADMMTVLLDSYLSQNGPSSTPSVVDAPCNFQECPPDSQNQQLFVVAKDKMHHLLATLHAHNTKCDAKITLRQVIMRGHAGICKIRCPKGCSYQWASSPYIGGKFLVNLRMACGYFGSGILPNQYWRICTFAGIGEQTPDTLRRCLVQYAEIVQHKSEMAMGIARDEEIEEDGGDGICITTDARHAHRKNSYRSDILALGQTNHRVLAYAPVTKEEERSSQKHEMRGTVKLYNTFDEMGAPLKTHFYWSMKRCAGSIQVLRDSLLNVVEHYQNRHDKCHQESRCRSDPRYRPSRVIITDSVAVEMLRKFITQQDIYRHAEDYVLRPCGVCVLWRSPSGVGGGRRSVPRTRATLPTLSLRERKGDGKRPAWSDITANIAAKEQSQ
ncbi:hypothetical protein Bbelb_349550 [Branchiostoma belcheri]|nr:hypothetical protein Bbelb_349550 [Branchiostoma belcheri]